MDFSFELVTFSGDLVEIVIRKLAPLFDGKTEEAQPLLQLLTKQNFIPESPLKSGVAAFQSGVGLDRQASGLW